MSSLPFLAIAIKDSGKREKLKVTEPGGLHDGAGVQRGWKTMGSKALVEGLARLQMGVG